MSEDILAKTQELMSRVKDDQDATNYLKKALDASLAILKTPSEPGGEASTTDVDLSSPTANSDEYAKMFAGIEQSFSDIFSELQGIRSTYTPQEYVEKAEELFLDSETDKKFEEYTSTLSFFESYENAFLRMIGMPSSDSIDSSESLFVVSPTGTLNEANRDRYMQILEQRQIGAAQRKKFDPETLYSMTEEVDPYETLEALGFNKVSELSEILDILGQIFSLDDMQSGAAADITASFSTKLYSAQGETSELQDDDYSALLRKRYDEVTNSFISRVGPQDRGVDNFSGTEETSPPPQTFEYVLPIVEAILHTIDQNVFPNISDETKRLLTNLVLGIEDPSFADLNKSSNFWRFSQLLFPPIQDEKIKGCINEASKLIAPPFLPKSSRKINNTTMRTSLLEAVIRIRIDAVSGAAISDPSLISQAPASVTGRGASISYSDIAESHGVLESLIIVRLFNAMAGMAKDVAKNIREIQQGEADNGLAPGAGSDEDDRDNRNLPLRRLQRSPEMARFDAIMALDDAMLFLLGKNSVNEAIDYQDGAARNSEIISASLMSSVLSIITVPGKWAKEKGGLRDFGSIIDSRAAGEEARGSTDATLGVARGVGAIDVMAFMIALFSVPESTLLGLLTDEQRVYMMLDFPSGFFDEFFRTEEGRKTVEESVREVSEAAYDAYEIFRLFLGEVREGLFVVD